MRFVSIALLFATWSFSSCGELVDMDSWPSNRTFDEQGGTVALDRVSLTIERGTVPTGTQIRIVEAAASEIPEGAIGEAYTVVAPDAPSFKGAELAYRLDMDELPDGVYYVNVVLAKATAGTWEQLPSIQDPISEEILALIDSPGVYSVIPLNE